MSRLALKVPFTIIFVVAVWTSLFIEGTFGFIQLLKGAKEKKHVYPKFYKDLNMRASIKSIFKQNVGLEYLFKKASYLDIINFRRIRNHRKNDLIKAAKKLGSVEIKNFQDFEKKSGKTSDMIIESENHVSTPETLDAAQCIKNQDLSFIPSLFKDKDLFLAINAKYEMTQKFLQREALPNEVVKFLEDVVANALKEEEGIKHSIENLVIKPDWWPFDSKERPIKIQIEQLVDIKELGKLRLNEEKRKKVFAKGYDNQQGSQNVIDFFNALSQLQQEHATYIIAKSFALKNGYSKRIERIEAEVDKKASENELHDANANPTTPKVPEKFNNERNPYNILKAKKLEQGKKKINQFKSVEE